MKSIQDILFLHIFSKKEDYIFFQLLIIAEIHDKLNEEVK